MIRGVERDARKEMKFWIAIPSKVKEDEEKMIYQGGWEWYRMPDDVYINKIYPTCPKCHQRYVPIGHYKRCFKCRFLDK